MFVRRHCQCASADEPLFLKGTELARQSKNTGLGSWFAELSVLSCVCSFTLRLCKGPRRNLLMVLHKPVPKYTTAPAKFVVYLMVCLARMCAIHKQCVCLMLHLIRWTNAQSDTNPSVKAESRRMEFLEQI